jgi:protein phosphatase
MTVGDQVELAMSSSPSYQPEPWEVQIAAVSDTGTECQHNEDHCGKWLKDKTAALAAVADGTAVLEGGELASQRAILALFRSFREQAAGMTQTQRLVRAARHACFEVYDLAVVVPQLRGVSTTLTAVAVSNAELTAAHVGNGRVYLIRGQLITQLSKDHTLAAEAEAPSEGTSCGLGEGLTRSLGRELLVPIDLFEMDLAQGDVVVLCTDGLYRVLEDRQIADLAGQHDAATACRALINQANAFGTPDNLSVAVVRVLGETPGRR